MPAAVASRPRKVADCRLIPSNTPHLVVTVDVLGDPQRALKPASGAVEILRFPLDSRHVSQSSYPAHIHGDHFDGRN